MLSVKYAALTNDRKMSENLPFFFLFAGSICHPKTMQRHVKTFLLHRELRHKDSFINDPESPALLSVALVNRTIVHSAFAAQVRLFIMCVAHVSRVYYRFIMFCAFVRLNLGHGSTEKFESFWDSNVLLCSFILHILLFIV